LLEVVLEVCELTFPELVLPWLAPAARAPTGAARMSTKAAKALAERLNTRASVSALMTAGGYPTSNCGWRDRFSEGSEPQRAGRPFSRRSRRIASLGSGF
jgi:hypothetical protein